MTPLARSIYSFALSVVIAFMPIEPFATEGASLKVIWSRVNNTNPNALPFFIRNVARTDTGALTLLGSDKQSQFLFVGPEDGGALARLNTKSQVFAIAPSLQDTFWIGGIKNQRAYVPGGDISDAYLAKVSSRGHVIFEHSFRSGKWRLIKSLAATPPGGVVTSGPDGSRTWVAMISQEGKVLWEQWIGIGKDTAVTYFNDQVWVTALEAVVSEDKRTYREDVTLWRFSASGNPIHQQVIRAGINDRVSARYVRLSMTNSKDALYVTSSWQEPSRAKPVEITKLDLNGQIVWQRELPNTRTQNSNMDAIVCNAGRATLLNGDFLIACPAKDWITLFRLENKTSTPTETSVPLPDCHTAAVLSLFQKSDGKIWIIGSRMEFFQAANCIWMGELTLQR